jgi:hypothetical protein
MISIVGKRGSGKTAKLFEQARKNNAMILTLNSHALREKAKALGYDDIEINGLGNLRNDDYSIGKAALIDESPYFLAALLDKYYGIKMIGFNATEE